MSTKAKTVHVVNRTQGPLPVGQGEALTPGEDRDVTCSPLVSALLDANRLRLLEPDERPTADRTEH